MRSDGGTGQILVEDQTPGTDTDRGHRLRADQREVVQRVAHACHPVGDGVITDLSVGRITAAEIVEVQHGETAACQAVSKDPVQSDAVHPLLAERTTDQYPTPDVVVGRQLQHAEQGGT